MILNSRGLTYLDFSLSDYQIYDCIDNKILDNTLNNLVLEIVRGRFRSEFIFITRTSHKCFRIYYNDELYTYHSYKDCIPNGNLYDTTALDITWTDTNNVEHNSTRLQFDLPKFRTQYYTKNFDVSMPSHTNVSRATISQGYSSYDTNTSQLITSSFIPFFGGLSLYIDNKTSANAVINIYLTSNTITYHVGENTYTEKYINGRKSVKPPNPILENQAFDGWYLDFNFGEPYAHDTVVTTDIDLYAHFVDAKVVTVYYYNTYYGIMVDFANCIKSEKFYAPVSDTLTTITFADLQYYYDFIRNGYTYVDYNIFEPLAETTDSYSNGVITLNGSDTAYTVVINLNKSLTPTSIDSGTISVDSVFAIFGNAFELLNKPVLGDLSIANMALIPLTLCLILFIWKWVGR